jgi:hypothetical protein
MKSGDIVYFDRIFGGDSVICEVDNDNDYTNFPILTCPSGQKLLGVKHRIRPATEQEKRTFIHSKLLGENRFRLDD